MSDAQNATVDKMKIQLNTLLDEVLAHDGFGDIRIEVRILKRKQKEVILHCGKQYRYVVDTPATQDSFISASASKKI